MNCKNIYDFLREDPQFNQSIKQIIKEEFDIELMLKTFPDFADFVRIFRNFFMCLVPEYKKYRSEKEKLLFLLDYFESLFEEIYDNPKVVESW
tara:strand:+ start:342 stop:620 length:279 start_codon:yes stop_codon:yes gene_type:complete